MRIHRRTLMRIEASRRRPKSWAFHPAGTVIETAEATLASERPISSQRMGRDRGCGADGDFVGGVTGQRGPPREEAIRTLLLQSRPFTTSSPRRSPLPRALRVTAHQTRSPNANPQVRDGEAAHQNTRRK